MPRDRIQRGRRAHAKQDAKLKRKVEDGHDAEASTQKRRKLELDDTPWSEDEYVDELDQEEGVSHGQGADDRPFYGLLDEQEQEYFKGADGMLEANKFTDTEDRNLFLENVYKEADGKELKLACSQSCSRLLERLIMLSSPVQLKHLFQKFSGNFLHLVQHRFASHCCETLLIKSAPVVTAELVGTQKHQFNTENGDEPVVSMENLFLYTLNELGGNLGYLMTDKFASHVFRLLFSLFAGQALQDSEATTLRPSRRKKPHQDPIQAEKGRELRLDTARSVPESFGEALRKMTEESIASMEPHYLRTLATHPNASLVLQRLIEYEMTHHKKYSLEDEKSILRRLLPDAPKFEGTESATFVNGMLYDPVGSRLLEVIVTFAPAKLFKALWRELLRDRFGALARNEVAGYVMGTLLNRLSKEDLEVAHDALLEQIPGLAARGRTAIIRTMVERCQVRGLPTQKLRDAIFQCWADDNNKTFSICKMLDVPPTISGSTNPDGHRLPGPTQHHSSEPTKPPKRLQDNPRSESAPHAQPIEHGNPLAAPSAGNTRRASAPATQTDSASILHRSLLAQSMLASPGPLAEMLFTSLSALSSAVCMHLALTSILSPVLQSSLTAPHATLTYRRKLINRFYSHIGALSLDPSGSHLVDAIWSGTSGMAFVRERVAEELAENQTSLRESSYGRKVWRNWKMDLYVRRRGQWVREMRESVGNEGFMSFPDGVANLHLDSRSTSRRSSARPSSRGSAWSAVSGGGGRQGYEDGPGQGSGEKPKTALDRARERHAAKKAGTLQQATHRGPPVSGSNSGALGGDGDATARSTRAAKAAGR